MIAGNQRVALTNSTRVKIRRYRYKAASWPVITSAFQLIKTKKADIAATVLMRPLAAGHATMRTLTLLQPSSPTSIQFLDSRRTILIYLSFIFRQDTPQCGPLGLFNRGFSAGQQGPGPNRQPAPALGWAVCGVTFSEHRSGAPSLTKDQRKPTPVIGIGHQVRRWFACRNRHLKEDIFSCESPRHRA
jgi:hypothetical protein